MLSNLHPTLTYLGVVILVLLPFIAILGIWDVFQKKHTVLRNFPIIGHLRYVAEDLGVFLRSYFYARDREELPFNRAQRSWIYQAAKNVETEVGFGSTRDLRPLGSIYFVDAPFPVLGRDAVEAREVIIGPYSPNPYRAKSLINISAMSYGAISENAILALSKGAKMAGCWLNTGEGGVSPYHLAGGCDIIAQIGTAKYGYRDADGNLSEEKLKQVADLPQVKMIEVKLSQGAKPGKGGILPGVKVSKEVAAIRGIPEGKDSISPNRHIDIANSEELLDFLHRVRTVSQKPVGFKTVLGDYAWLDDLFTEILKRGIESAPDFISLDGAEGGTGAAPMSLVDFMGLPIAESLPALIDKLYEYGLRDRVKVIASGKIVTPDMVAWALCVGADFINSARGFLFSLGCIQALKCHTNKCPTGVATHNPWLMRGLDPSVKSVRVFHYVKNLEHEVGIICHSCGVKEPRELTRHHVRSVTQNGTSVSLAEIYPYKTAIKAPSAPTEEH